MTEPTERTQITALLDHYARNPGAKTLKIPVRGYNIIRHPMLNKSTGFSVEERRALGLEGLLPSQCNSMAVQAERTYQSLQRKSDPLERYIGLASLQDRNEHLFYRVLRDHLEEFMPVVYTPTVGLATQTYSHHFRRARGLWITPEHKGRVAEVLQRAARGIDVRLLVVTDNESILGIGDQGAGGMAIAVGKLALYCASAGIHPLATLPVSLDVGTDNQKLLDDPLYLGWRHARLRGEEYDALVEEFVDAVAQVFPRALVQWEDFRKDNALKILDTYRGRLLSFNDDIQGTGGVAAAGVVTAARVSGVPLAEQRIVIHGAGAAGLGIARQLKATLVASGCAPDRAATAVAVLDSRGLLVANEGIREAYKRELAWPESQANELGLSAGQRHLEAVVERFKPHVLIGTSGQPGAFSQHIVKTMASACERPVILPFSNPTDYSEARPADLYAWTDGRVLVATGSPFDPVTHNGKEYAIGQGNNVFIFPGLGLGALASGAREVTDGMITAAIKGLAESVTDEELSAGLLFPRVARLHEVSYVVAQRVMQGAFEDGVAAALNDPESALKDLIWEPTYRDYEPV